MTHAPDQYDPNRLGDAEGTPEHARRAARPYSPDIEQHVRDSFGSVHGLLDGGRLDEALAALAVLPKESERREVAHLLPNVPDGARRFVALGALHDGLRAYEDGVMRFSPDLSNVAFDPSPEKEHLLTLGFACGALNRAVILAFPTIEQVEEIAVRLAANNNSSMEEMRSYLLEAPAWSFLVSHLRERGGLVAINHADMRDVRWPTDGVPIWKKLYDLSREEGVAPEEWLESRFGAEGPAYRSLHERVYAALPEPPRLAEVLGSVTLFFTNADRIVAPATAVLSDGGVSDLAQGQAAFNLGMNFIRVREHRVTPLNPVQHLALASAIADPRDLSTYPSCSASLECLEGMVKHGGFEVVSAEMYKFSSMSMSSLSPQRRARSVIS